MKASCQSQEIQRARLFLTGMKIKTHSSKREKENHRIDLKQIRGNQKPYINIREKTKHYEKLKEDKERSRKG